MHFTPNVCWRQTHCTFCFSSDVNTLKAEYTLCKARVKCLPIKQLTLSGCNLTVAVTTHWGSNGSLKCLVKNHFSELPYPTILGVTSSHEIICLWLWWCLATRVTGYTHCLATAKRHLKWDRRPLTSGCTYLSPQQCAWIIGSQKKYSNTHRRRLLDSVYVRDLHVRWCASMAEKKKYTEHFIFFTTVLDLIKSIVSVHHFKGNFAAVVPAYHTETTTGN